MPAPSRMVRQLARALERQLGRRAATPRASSPSAQTLIVFYNTMWGEPLDVDGIELPAGCRLTADRDQLGQAAAVVFHIPSLSALPLSKPPGQLWVAWSL